MSKGLKRSLLSALVASGIGLFALAIATTVSVATSSDATAGSAVVGRQIGNSRIDASKAPDSDSLAWRRRYHRRHGWRYI